MTEHKELKTTKDFLYEHEIDLIGAIELFGARDLTDCGFYQKDLYFR